MNINISKIKKLIEMLGETDITELEIKEGEETIRISRQSTVSPSCVSVFNPMLSNMPQAVLPDVENKAAASITHAEPLPHAGQQIKSPMVGTLYLSPSPGAKPFVEIGQKVHVGDTLCIIEAMKMFNQIEADVSGIVKAKLVENAQPVEFEQPLFIIET